MQEGFSAFPPVERWDDWVERGRHYSLVPTTCFNCARPRGLFGVRRSRTKEVRKFEGNPPPEVAAELREGARDLNQITDPERILFAETRGRAVKGSGSA
jgi:hypothetical protein